MFTYSNQPFRVGRSLSHVIHASSVGVQRGNCCGVPRATTPGGKVLQFGEDCAIAYASSTIRKFTCNNGRATKMAILVAFFKPRLNLATRTAVFVAVTASSGGE